MLCRMDTVRKDFLFVRLKDATEVLYFCFKSINGVFSEKQPAQSSILTCQAPSLCPVCVLGNWICSHAGLIY